MRAVSVILLVVFLLLESAFLVAQSNSAVLTVKNAIDLNRQSETVVLSAGELRKLLSIDDVRKIHIRDEAGKDVLTQAVDNNDDGVFDDYIFQIDIGPNATKTFTLIVGEKQVPKKEDFKAYGRFVQERREDFAWENDRIAHRMYGKELETWPQEPLTSSGVDVWTKRTPRLIVNEWYMTDDYHHDHGDGADMYSVGKSRGCGGNGIYVDGKLYTSANFIRSKTLANGPIRVMFELEYPAWNAGGTQVTEVKRITLDAGQNMDKFESRYKVQGDTAGLLHAAGIKNNAGSAQSTRPEAGTLRTWEPVKADGSQLGCAVMAKSDQLVKFAEDAGNYLAVTKFPADGVVIYYAGFGWNKFGFPSVQDWDRYVADWSRRINSPLQITLSAK